ncbi:class I SAM-dependent methyltransferase [Paenibacillus harenae]|uniref:tRNA (Cmo5U34)-methyltransferase n=1 Tax=Paenibacillus harenae TaxID=306543 RepID=A0ABT9U641_PAEHA|nr:class I SAM-dependent methyltransferase [Paenibacillus harenae]MDQ0115093.1 tRNA (cmo5U34)-methyltransferase [Paenibacillus harenae]
MNHIVKQQFDAAAQQYDQQRRQLIPRFDDFYGTAVQWLELDTPRPSIIDLGAGTGLLSAFVLAKYPQAHITLIDFSEHMLSQARRRLASYENVTYITADYLNYPYEQAESYDAVVSSLSIHHLTHPDKRSLFRTIFRLLKDGGLFINADQAEGMTPAIDRRYMELWKQAVHATGLPIEAIEASIERRKQDINAKASDQIDWLLEAGFANVDAVYRHHEFNVFFAQKI